MSWVLKSLENALETIDGQAAATLQSAKRKSVANLLEGKTIEKEKKKKLYLILSLKEKLLLILPQNKAQKGIWSV